MLPGRGREPGVYSFWGHAEDQVRGYPNGRAYRLPTLVAAEARWAEHAGGERLVMHPGRERPKGSVGALVFVALDGRTRRRELTADEFDRVRAVCRPPSE